MTTRSDSSVKEKIFDIPGNLAARCMRLHGWDATFTDKAIDGYLQFMTIKTRNEDWYGSILSPSLPVDLVWHQHILDPRHYAKACQDYAGEVIGHDPDGGMDQVARQDRIRTTKIALRTLYGPGFDKEVWSFGDDLTREGSNKRPRLVSPEHTPAPRNDVSPEVSRNLKLEPDPNRKITIMVRDQTVEKQLEDLSFRVKKRSNMQELFDAYAQRVDVEGSRLRFCLYGERIDSSNTPIDLEMEDQSQIDVMLEQVGC